MPQVHAAHQVRVTVDSPDGMETADYVRALRAKVESEERRLGQIALATGDFPVAAVANARPNGGWSRDVILTRLDRVYRLAMVDRRYPAAIRCLELAGYEFGMFTKRVEVDSYSDEQLQRIAEKAGLTLEQLRDAERFLTAEVLND